MDRVPGRCLATVLVIASVAPTAAIAADRPSRASRYVPDELIVRFKPGVSGAERADARRDHGATVERGLRVPRAQLLDLEGSSVRSAEAAFERDPRVEYAEPNYVFRAESNDQYFTDLWGLENLGASGGLLDADIDAPEAWAAEQPAGDVTVAIVDTGVDPSHPDLAGRLIPGWDFVDDDSIAEDLDSHGTHVAGTIGALRDNGEGVAGVSDQVAIMPLRALDPTGSGTNADVADAFERAGDDEVPIVNASLSGPSYSQAIRDAIEAAPNTLFVVAAGNSGANIDADQDQDQEPDQPRYPCSYTAVNVLCVAASDRTDARASFSNWGPASVDIAAPGQDIASTYVAFPDSLDERFGGASLPAGWSSQSLLGSSEWAISTASSSDAGTNSVAITPSGPYADSADTVLVAPAVDVTGKQSCRVLFDLALDVADNGGDVFRVETATDPNGPWTTAFSRSVDTPDGDFDLYGAAVPAGGLAYIRFRFTSDATQAGDAVTVDFVEVGCATPGYAFLNGTSMATPHVAGAAALVLSQQPTLTVQQLKDQILASGDPSACWTGLTVTGRRLNLARAIGVDVPAGPTATSCGNGSITSQPPSGQEQTPAPPPSAPPPGTGSTPPPPTDGGGATEQPAVDRSAPVVGLSVGRVQRLASLLRSGLRTGVRCSERCTVSARLYARTASGRAVLVGRSARVTSRGGRVTATIRLSRQGRAFLRRGPRRRTLTLSLSASDAAGNVRKLRRRVSLRR